MYNYIVYLCMPKTEPKFQAFRQIASNNYAARKMVTIKHCKFPIWWVVKLDV